MRKCHWCGLSEEQTRLFAGAPECIDSNACAERVADAGETSMTAEIHSLRAEVARLREALVTIDRTGAPGAAIVAQRDDGHSCSWCRGMVTPCPVVTARAALSGTSDEWLRALVTRAVEACERQLRPGDRGLDAEAVVEEVLRGA